MALFQKNIFTKNIQVLLNIFLKIKKKNLKNPVMLIFNKKLSVSPITTHIPVKKINKMIEKKTIINNITAISNFYKSKLNKKLKIAILGLNPHCETSSKFSEEKNYYSCNHYFKKKRFSCRWTIPC